MSCPINQKPQSSLRQLYRTLKMKMIDAHKAGKGCKKIVKCFQVPSSSVWNVMKKGQWTETVRNGGDRTLMWTVWIFFTYHTSSQIQKHRQNQVSAPSNCNLSPNYPTQGTRSKEDNETQVRLLWAFRVGTDRSRGPKLWVHNEQRCVWNCRHRINWGESDRSKDFREEELRKIPQMRHFCFKKQLKAVILAKRGLE